MGWIGNGREAKDAEFLELVSSRTGHLYRSACLLTSGDTHYAEDLVQEALSRMYVLWRRSAWTGRSRIDNPAAYTHTVMVRAFLAQQRRRSSGERPTDALPEPEGREDSDSTLRLTLLDALGRLSAKDRAVLVLRYWEDRSVEETAEVLHASSGAVRTRTTRALAKLRTLLGDSLGELAGR